MNGQDNLINTQVPDSVRQFLCYFASGDIERPLPIIEVNWDLLLQFLISNGLVGIVFYYLQYSPFVENIPNNFIHNVKQIHRNAALKSTLMNRHIKAIIEKLNILGIEYRIVKGPVLAYNFYPHPTMRIYTDLDIIVHERNWHDIYNFMLANDFQQEGILPPTSPKFAESLVVHETKYNHSQNNLQVELHYDDFLETGLISRHVEGYWERSIPATLENTPFWTLSVEDHLLYLCAHVHYHGYTRLNWLADIAYLIRTSTSLNWETFIAVAELEEAQVPAYYTLKFVQDMLGIHLPEEILSRLQPDWLRRRLHDIFMPQQKILSLNPVRMPNFRFHFQPFFERALPSILVMGRRREKIQIMTQVAIPSEYWLRHYYGLHDDVWILPYYLRRLAYIITGVKRKSPTSNSKVI